MSIQQEQSNALHMAIVGGWEPYTTIINEEASKIFNEVTSNLLGVEYEALAVATQVVAGINYSFFCNAKVVGSGFNQAVTIRVYVNLDGKLDKPSITPVTR